MKKSIVIEVQDLVIFNETNNNLNVDDIKIVAILPNGKGILLNKSQVGGGAGNTPNLQAVLTEGNQATTDILIGGLNVTNTFKTFRNGLFGMFSATTIRPNLIEFENQTNKTTLAGSSGVEAEVILTLPNESGTLASREWVEAQKPLALITTLTTTGLGVAPIPYINRNNLASGVVPISILYAGVGIYSVTVTGIPAGFTIDDIHISFGNFVYDGFGGAITADSINYTGDILLFTIKTKVNPSTFSDFLLAKTPMKIELYKPL